MATTYIINNNTNLTTEVATTWIAGWVNGGSPQKFLILQPNGTFAAPKSSSPIVPFYRLCPGEEALTILLRSSQVDPSYSGNNRLLFVVSSKYPEALKTINNAPVGFTGYPHANPPGVAAPGPFDIFEFGMNAQDDVSAANGFGLNLSFEVNIAGINYSYGTNPKHLRSQMGRAYQKFIADETKHFPSAQAYSELLYLNPLAYPPPDSNPPAPLLVAGQYFGICDPNDQLAAETNNYTISTVDPLASFWDATLLQFFAPGNYLSIDLSADPEIPNIYSGQCTHSSGQLPSYTLSNGNASYQFPLPQVPGSSNPGITGAQYVFQQAFGPYSPGGSGGDAGLLQDNIWEALCRGVAVGGVSSTLITRGESTIYWNDPDNWYEPGTPCHLYAKFLHYSTIEGTDSRLASNGPPTFYNNAAYGFNMDENPNGQYSGPNVPSKTVENVPDGSTVYITVGPWVR